MLKFLSPAIMVKSIKLSKTFYSDILDLEIMMDNGEHVVFKDGLSLWQIDSAYNNIFKKKPEITKNNIKYFELYFETDNLDDIFKQFSNKDIKFIHEVHEQPWGQRCFRFYDTDDHIIEIAEEVETFVTRLYNDGMTIDQLIEKTHIPIEVLKTFLQKGN